MPDRGTDELEGALRGAGATFRAEPTPDVASAVRTRLAAPATTAVRRPKRWRAAAGAAAGAVLLALVPGVREAVADLIDSLPGITFNYDRGGDTSTPQTGTGRPDEGAPLGAPLGMLGATTLEDARDRVPYDLPVPSVLGDPDAVYVREGVVTMLWRASPDLPALAGSDVGLVIDIVDGSRGAVFEKLLLDVEVEWFRLDGMSAAWVGQAHPLVMVNIDGMPDRELERVASRTLLISGGTTIRIESLLDRDGAVDLARTLR